MLSIMFLVSLFILLASSMPKNELGYSFASLSRFDRSTQLSQLFNGKFFATLGAGIMGSIKGKVGGIVGSSWKGINTVREYKIPANPDTPDQQLQRSRFSAIQALASSLLSTIVANYWNPFAVKMSGYNYFIQQNINALADSTYYLTTSNILSKGNLENVASGAGVLAAGSVSVTWSDAISGNGLATDLVDAVVINKETNATYFAATSPARSAKAVTVTVTGETTASKLLLFLVVNRGSGSSYVVSTASGIQITA